MRKIEPEDFKDPRLTETVAEEELIRYEIVPSDSDKLMAEKDAEIALLGCLIITFFLGASVASILIWLGSL